MLTDVLEQQYAKVDISESTNKNIQLLKEENTFTVVTGH
ncbi:MAG: bacillithiol biosynthesis BshC, partial [Polaribacter sp.]|nr:bacillithiol biosynthesis BshC [Polaribacter sp.]